MTFDVTAADIATAAQRIRGRVRNTPTYVSPRLSRLLGAETVIKCESLQLGGSFKLRGSLNKLLQMSEAERAKGVVTVSGGNHAIAVSMAATALGCQALVLMPKTTPALNIRLTEEAGGTVEICEDAIEAFARADAYGRQGRVNVHSFDDPAIIAGHGTLGLELAAESPAPLDHLFISIGGGGFLAGVATALKTAWPKLRIHGVETEGAETMTLALQAGKPVPIRSTSLARTLGAPFATERTLAAARAYLEEIVLVSDKAAVEALLAILAEERLLVEPAAACTLAAALMRRNGFAPGERVGLILCGSNVAHDDILGWKAQFGL